MGYNIQDVGGTTSDAGGNVWTATLDLTDPGATTVTGDFDAFTIFGNAGEANAGYTFSAVSNPLFGSVVGNPVDGTYTFTVDKAATMASGSDQVVNFTVTGADTLGTQTDTVVITLLICVARGTLVQTPCGAVPVETLQAGDLVNTLDRPPQPVRWIGSRKVDTAELRADASLYPIRIKQGALGENRPQRDLLVTQNHRIYLEDWRAELLFAEPQVLVPAKSLLNDSTILRDVSVQEIEYFHLLFDDHNVIFTDGAPTESLHPGNYTMSAMTPESQQELKRLLPRLDTPDGYGATARYGLKPWEGTMLRDVAEQRNE